jgi:hypothetical protein
MGTPAPVTLFGQATAAVAVVAVVVVTPIK